MKSAQNNFCEFTSENPRVFYQPYPASGYGRLRRHARPAGAFFCCLIALGWLVDLGLSDTLGYPVGYSKSCDFSWFHDVSIEHHWTRPYWKYTPFSDTAIWVHYLGLTGGLTLKTYSNQKLRNAVTSHKSHGCFQGKESRSFCLLWRNKSPETAMTSPYEMFGGNS